jgi:hypothetical protein
MPGDGLKSALYPAFITQKGKKDSPGFVGKAGLKSIVTLWIKC